MMVGEDTLQETLQLKTVLWWISFTLEFGTYFETQVQLFQGPFDFACQDIHSFALLESHHSVRCTVFHTSHHLGHVKLIR